MVSAMDYQQNMKDNFTVLARLERAKMGSLTVSSPGTPRRMTGEFWNDVGAVAAHFLAPNQPSVSFYNNSPHDHFN